MHRRADVSETLHTTHQRESGVCAHSVNKNMYSPSALNLKGAVWSSSYSRTYWLQNFITWTPKSMLNIGPRHLREPKGHSFTYGWGPPGCPKYPVGPYTPYVGLKAILLHTAGGSGNGSTAWKYRKPRTVHHLISKATLAELMRGAVGGRASRPQQNGGWQIGKNRRTQMLRNFGRKLFLMSVVHNWRNMYPTIGVER